MEVIKGAVYKHFKGNYYIVLNIAKHSETQEDYVVYQHIHTGTIYVRPMSMWFDYIDRDDYKGTRFIMMEEFS